MPRPRLQLEVETAEPSPDRAGQLQQIDQAITAELDNMKRFLEARDGPTGRWDGIIPSPDERPPEGIG